MKFTKLLSVFLFIGMVGMVSCGDEDDSTSVVIDDPSTQQRQEEEQEGTFSTEPMVVVNNNIENNVKVETETEIENDDVTVVVQCQDADQNVNHRQHVYTGTRCPTQADDTNGDGIIDFVETQAVVGTVLINLDSDIEAPTENSFPRGSSYAYRIRASRTRLVTALPPGEKLTLNGRAVVVYGVATTRVLPATVTTGPGLSQQESLPISCGVIRQRTTSGGTTGL